MNLLLHICCAPCSVYPLKLLLGNPANCVKGFFFNPNIHPYSEYSKRRAAVTDYSKIKKIEVIYPDYAPAYFFRKVAYNESKPARCRICWQIRLEETALYASESGFDAFSTTLLVSPYQDHSVIREEGFELAGKYGVKFYYQDFREGFRQSQAEARAQGLYTQKYCGCVFSEIERFRKIDYSDLKKIAAIK